MSGFLLTIIVLCAVIITVAVIMQPSKDGGLGGLASGGVTDSVFGANRNEFLAKATWWLMAIFLISSIALAKHQTAQRDAAHEKLNKKSSIETDEGTTKGSNIQGADSPKDAADKLKDILKDKTDDAEKSTDDAEKKLDETKSDIEKKVDEAKEDVEKATDEASNKVDEAKTDVEKAAEEAKDDLKKALEN